MADPNYAGAWLACLRDLQRTLLRDVDIMTSKLPMLVHFREAYERICDDHAAITKEFAAMDPLSLVGSGCPNKKSIVVILGVLQSHLKSDYNHSW